MTVIVNLLLYQAGWFACVLSAAGGRPWIGAVTVAFIVAWHLARAARPRPELALIGAAVAAGTAFETLLVQSGCSMPQTKGLVFRKLTAHTRGRREENWWGSNFRG
jgi:hypothetical protein